MKSKKRRAKVNKKQSMLSRLVSVLASLAAPFTGKAKKASRKRRTLGKGGMFKVNAKPARKVRKDKGLPRKRKQQAPATTPTKALVHTTPLAVAGPVAAQADAGTNEAPPTMPAHRFPVLPLSDQGDGAEV